MTTHSVMIAPDPKLDLVFERVVDVSTDLVWAAWTTPEHLVKWFTPAPWSTVDCEIDLRPGGIFRTVMRSPEGQDFPNVGCWLEIIEGERLAWTNALLPGFRPRAQPAPSKDHPCDELTFTAVVTLERRGKGTKYTAVAMHSSEAAKKSHVELGFHDGWGKAFDQLVALVAKM